MRAELLRVDDSALVLPRMFFKKINTVVNMNAETSAYGCVL